MSYDAESLSDCDSIAALHPPEMLPFADVYHIFFHLLPYTDAAFKEYTVLLRKSLDYRISTVGRDVTLRFSLTHFISLCLQEERL